MFKYSYKFESSPPPPPLPRLIPYTHMLIPRGINTDSFIYIRWCAHIFTRTHARLFIHPLAVHATASTERRYFSFFLHSRLLWYFFLFVYLFTNLLFLKCLILTVFLRHLNNCLSFSHIFVAIKIQSVCEEFTSIVPHYFYQGMQLNRLI